VSLECLGVAIFIGVSYLFGSVDDDLRNTRGSQYTVHNTRGSQYFWRVFFETPLPHGGDLRLLVWCQILKTKAGFLETCVNI
jgi:hypothetical protein